ncbi:MAG: hypothetical protein ACK5TN_03710 [Acidobacteriota bacterium]|jgi:hypothetical protein
MSVTRLLLLFPGLSLFVLLSQEPYKGPVPEKADVPHIRHANKLVPTDVGEAKDESAKGDTIYTVPGAAATARTPLTEPSFIIKVNQLNVQQMQLYRMEVKGGQRQLMLPQKPKKNSPRPLRLSLDSIGSGLFRLEVQEPLENGEYCLSPGGSNAVYCFAVY